MAEVGLAGVKNKNDSPPPDMKENGSSDGLFTLCKPPEPTIPEPE